MYYEYLYLPYLSDTKLYLSCIVLFVICDQSASTMFFHTILQKARFSKKKNVEDKMCFWIYSTTSLGK